MFEQTFIPTTRTHRTWTVWLAVVAQAAAVGIAVLIPMLYLQVLPERELVSYLVAPPPPPPPPPPPARLPKAVKTEPQSFQPKRLFAPRFIPKKIEIPKAREIAPAPEVAGVVGGVPGGVPGGALGGLIGSVIGSAGRVPPPPPPPAAAPKTAAAPIIHVGGKLQEAMLVREVQPVYPPLAKTARVQGTVQMDAIIDKTGRIESLKVVKGNPLLVPAAMRAVRQWVYKPTELNGQAVQVATEIDVNFTLS